MAGPKRMTMTGRIVRVLSRAPRAMADTELCLWVGGSPFSEVKTALSQLSDDGVLGYERRVTTVSNGRESINDYYWLASSPLPLPGRPVEVRTDASTSMNGGPPGTNGGPSSMNGSHISTNGGQKGINGCHISTNGAIRLDDDAERVLVAAEMVADEYGRLNARSLASAACMGLDRCRRAVRVLREAGAWPYAWRMGVAMPEAEVMARVAVARVLKRAAAADPDRITHESDPRIYDCEFDIAFREDD